MSDLDELRKALTYDEENRAWCGYVHFPLFAELDEDIDQVLSDDEFEAEFGDEIDALGKHMAEQIATGMSTLQQQARDMGMDPSQFNLDLEDDDWEEAWENVDEDHSAAELAPPDTVEVKLFGPADGGPTKRQLQQLRHVREREQHFLQLCVECLYEYLCEFGNPDFAPESAEELRDSLELPAIYVAEPDAETEGKTEEELEMEDSIHWGIAFVSDYEFEYGLGVRFIGDEAIEVGYAEVVHDLDVPRWDDVSPEMHRYLMMIEDCQDRLVEFPRLDYDPDLSMLSSMMIDAQLSALRAAVVGLEMSRDMIRGRAWLTIEQWLNEAHAVLSGLSGLSGASAVVPHLRRHLHGLGAPIAAPQAEQQPPTILGGQEVSEHFIALQEIDQRWNTIQTAALLLIEEETDYALRTVLMPALQWQSMINATPNSETEAGRLAMDYQALKDELMANPTVINLLQDLPDLD